MHLMSSQLLPDSLIEQGLMRHKIIFNKVLETLTESLCEFHIH